MQFGGIGVGHRAKHLGRELTTDHRGGLRDLLGAAEPIQAIDQR